MLAMLMGPCIAGDVLVVRPGDANFKVALQGIQAEIDDELTLIDYTVDGETTLEDFSETYQKQLPKVLVLMEGRSITLYEQWQQAQPPNTPFPPALVMMTAYVEERIQGLKNVYGIKYEIQALQSISLLRSVLDQAVKRVGVIYSSNLRVFFSNQKASCEKEQIDLVGIQVDENSPRLEKVISDNLKQLIDDPTIDAIWIFNDNLILKDVHLEWAWVPRLKKAKKPVVVSLERLVSPLRVGQFAVVPDHNELGTQAARWILQMQSANWKTIPGSEQIRKPYSAYKKMDSSIMPKNIKIHHDVAEEEWFDFSKK